VLDTLDVIKVCTGYELDGEMIESFPAVSHDARRIKPVYTTLPGWQTTTLGTTNFETATRQSSTKAQHLKNGLVKMDSESPL
jgi:adenylosuccinate synthase